MTIRVLIADDQPPIRRAFRAAVDAQPDMTVVAEVGDGRQAVAQARRLRPDVSLVDVRMPVLDGIQVVEALAGPGRPDPLRVVVVTTFDLDEYVHGALRGGASGFLLKRSDPDLLVSAIRAAVAGDTLISPRITVRLLDRLGRRGEPGAVAGLTRREREIAEAVADGLTNAEIARTLFIAPGTVKNHLAAVQRKLGARNRVSLAAAVWSSRPESGPNGT
ncbi:response regulator [Phytoactinopolyspora endophytica]|uniref:response regulator n=1 Tax=Phytoactinopolyspora endophytica TaxID=1642495 RepID=UPI00101C115E|nr:response regulator transcription factor [Phytoactinopolyspora endophytica]